MAPAEMIGEQIMNEELGHAEMPISNVERPGATYARGGPAPHIEMIQGERLTPYAGNARSHSKAQIRQIAKNIERFGYVNPVLIDDDGQIIAGDSIKCNAGILLARYVRLVSLGWSWR